MRSSGTANVSAGQAPAASGNTIWSRWFALSVRRPSQQLGKSKVRTTFWPSGHRGYMRVVSPGSPEQPQFTCSASRPPSVTAFALPEEARSRYGMGSTLLTGLPWNCSSTVSGSSTRPVFIPTGGEPVPDPWPRARRPGQQ